MTLSGARRDGRSTFDVAVVGGGIVGISTALHLLRSGPTRRIVLIEKENRLALHQTGRNSGVIHAGVYYEPGGLKSRFCRRGLRQTIDYCRTKQIDFEQRGKLLVATRVDELEGLSQIYNRCKLAEVDVEMIGESKLAALEPNVVGLQAIWVRESGIVDYAQVAAALAADFETLGGVVLKGSQVVGFDEAASGVKLALSRSASQSSLASGSESGLRASYVVCCGGLEADRLAKLMGIPSDIAIVPYRGEYYRLAARHRDIVQRLIYPIPNPELPFLGIHITPMIGGHVTVGPNATQGFKREGYGTVNFNLRDVAEMVRFPGFWRASRRNIRAGLVEARNSWWTRGYLRQVQRYCPKILLQDLKPHPAGVRAQAVRADGTFVHDFLFAQSDRSFHVLNAPSPAATSALPIGAHIATRVSEALG